MLWILFLLGLTLTKISFLLGQIQSLIKNQNGM